MNQPQPENETPEEQPAPEQAPAPDESAARIVGLEAALNEAKDKMMRALADAENTRRRAVKEREDGAKFAVTSFAKDLLDFSDNFHRALAAIPEDLKNSDPRLSSVIDGITAMEQT